MVANAVVPSPLVLAVADGPANQDAWFPIAFFGVYILFWLVLMAIIVASYGVGIWTIADAARRPEYQFAATGQSKELWIVLPAIGLVICQPVAFVAGLIYLLSVRKKLMAVPVPPPGWFAYGQPHHPGYSPYQPQPYPQPYPIGGAAPGGAPAGTWPGNPSPTAAGPYPGPVSEPVGAVRLPDFAPPPHQPSAAAQPPHQDDLGNPADTRHPGDSAPDQLERIESVHPPVVPDPPNAD